MTIAAIPPKKVNELWPRVVADIERALKRTKVDLFNAEDIRLSCIRGNAMMLVAFEEIPDQETPEGFIPKHERIDGVAIAKIDDYPRARVCAVPIVAGRNLKAWKDEMLDTLKQFARESGASRMMGGGRIGWMRAAGFADGGHTLVLEL